MIGAVYNSDQRIVDIYRDVSTIAGDQGGKMSPDDVFNYIELISVNKKALMNFKPICIRKVS